MALGGNKSSKAAPLSARERWMVNPMASCEDLVMNAPVRVYERIMSLEEEFAILSGEIDHMNRSGPRYFPDRGRVSERYKLIKSLLDHSPAPEEPNQG